MPHLHPLGSFGHSSWTAAGASAAEAWESDVVAVDHIADDVLAAMEKAEAEEFATSGLQRHTGMMESVGELSQQPWMARPDAAGLAVQNDALIVRATPLDSVG